MYDIKNMDIKYYDFLIKFWEKIPGIGIGKGDEKENIEKFILKNQDLNFVAINENDDIIASVMCGTDGRRGYIYHLAVDEMYRKKGIGTELVNKVLENLKKITIDKCHIFVFCINDDGIKFWEKIKWKKREDIFVFSKDI